MSANFVEDHEFFSLTQANNEKYIANENIFIGLSPIEVASATRFSLPPTILKIC